jgi:hypothetical protein
MEHKCLTNFHFFFLEIGGAVSAAGGVSDGVSPLPPFTFLPSSQT